MGLAPSVDGHFENGWGAVADAFHQNFTAHHELGAACCVYLEGRPVVDLWGGVSDRRTGEPWGSDTIVVVFSTTKGATALCANLLDERGLLDMDAPVAAYWPEFAQAGKEGISVRQVLSHQAGLPVVDEALSLEDACAWYPVIRALEHQAPRWQPGTEYGYHALTYGFLVGEIVRQVTGETIGSFFRREIAHPLALSAWIGLPDELEPRVALLDYDPSSVDTAADARFVLGQVPPSVEVPSGAAEVLRARWESPDSADRQAMTLGGAFSVLVSDNGGHNAKIVRASEHPGSAMVSDARSVARMYAATIGEVDGVRLLRSDTVDRMSMVQTAGSRPHGVDPKFAELMQAIDLPFGLGVVRPSPLIPMLSPRSFGHPGFGGSIGFADPETGLAFSYVMNRLATSAADPRLPTLLKAVERLVA